MYDGGGYVIYNAVQGTNAGLFSSMVGGAVVRNVTFMNAQLTGEGGFIVTGLYDSTIENVVVYGSIAAGVGGANWAPASLVVSKAYENSTVKNCLVVLKNHELTGANYAGMIIGDDQSNGTLTIEHCIAVNLKMQQIKTDMSFPQSERTVQAEDLPRGPTPIRCTPSTAGRNISPGRRERIYRSITVRLGNSLKIPCP